MKKTYCKLKESIRIVESQRSSIYKKQSDERW